VVVLQNIKQEREGFMMSLFVSETEEVEYCSEWNSRNTKPDASRVNAFGNAREKRRP
jgi:hypothetical protein